MKFLLTTLNSKYIHSNLALKYLYASAKKNSKSMTIQEFTINNDDDYIFTELIQGDYDIVCFSCYIWNVDRTLYIAKNLKRAIPGIRIIMGGPEVSFDTIPFLSRHKFIDMIISGEGEAAFAQLTDELLSEEPKLERIKGLTYRLNGKIFVNPAASPQDFQKVPFPYTDLPIEKDKIIYYESSRGCPFRCSYCLSSVDGQMRSLPIARVKEDLKVFLDRRVTQVKFIDRTFNWDQNRCLEIMEYLIQQDNGLTNFHFELCGELINNDMIAVLGKVRKDLFQFEIGVQSTNERSLKACNRASDFNLLAQNVKSLIAADNVHIHLDLIAGLPYEDYDSFKKSFNDVYALKAHHLQLGFLKLIKGSPIREQREQFGYVYRDKAPYEIISSNYISSYGLIRLKMIEKVVELFYNRGGFKQTLEFAVSNLADTPFDFYEELSAFYYLKGFQHKSHKKEDLYRIFLSYMDWKDRFIPNSRDQIKELLTEDMAATLNPEAVKKFERKGWTIL